MFHREKYKSCSSSTALNGCHGDIRPLMTAPRAPRERAASLCVCRHHCQVLLSSHSSRTPLLVSDGMAPPSQSGGTISHPPDMSSWNPFGEDNFSKLTEEELIDREFDLLRAGR